jgi:para-nitrobenzyl esterase
MHQYWVQFAKSGDPNGKNLPRWPAYTSANANTLLISNGGTGVKEALRKKQLDLVESIGLKRLEGGQ